MEKKNLTQSHELLAQGVKELVLREGKAADLFNPRIVSITGVLAAPYQFLDSAKLSNYDAQRSHILVNLEDKRITLNLHETEHFMHQVTGVLVPFSDLDAFGINEDKRFTHRDMVQLFKKYKFYFASPDEHAAFLKNFENFNAKVTKDIKDARENSGNSTKSISTIVDSAFKEAPTFKLNIPLFKGYPKILFTVELCLDADDGRVVFFLESGDLFKLEKELAEQYIGDQLTLLKDKFACSQVHVG